MSTSSVATITADGDRATASETTNQWFIGSPLAWSLIAIAHVPLILSHSLSLWRQAHYLALPAIYIGIAVLIWRVLNEPIVPVKGRAAVAQNQRREFYATVLFLLGALIFILAVLANSPYSGQLSATFFLGSFLLAIRRRIGILHMLTVVAFFGLTAIPSIVSHSLEVMFTTAVTWSSAGILETIYIPNLAKSGLIEIANPPVLIVPQICYGLESFILLLTVAGLMLIWKPQSLAVLLTTLLAMALSTIVVNDVRVVLVAALRTWSGIDLAFGVNAIIFHYVAAAVTVLIGLSVVQFVKAMLEVIPPPRDSDDPVVAVLAYNSLVGWPLPAPWKYKSRRTSSGTGAQPSAEPSADVATVTGPSDSALPAALVSIILLCLAGLFCLVWVTSESQPTLKPFGIEMLDKLPGKDSLDRVKLGYSKIEFERETRVPLHQLGQYSHFWQTELPESAIWLDFLLPVYVRMEDYYAQQNAGWDIKSVKTWSASDAASGAPFKEVEMLNPETSVNAYLLYGVFDRNGEMVAEPPPAERLSWSGAIMARLRNGPLRLVLGKPNTGPAQPTDLYQVRYLITSPVIKDSERERARKSFVTIFSQLHSETMAAEQK